MAPKRPLPSAVSGGWGGPLNERGGSLWGTLFECLFFNAFSDALFEASEPILEVLGFNFGHFGRLLGSFWLSRQFFENCAPVQARAQKSGSWDH